MPRPSLAFLPRNDKQLMVKDMGKKRLCLTLVIARAESPWRSIVFQKVNRTFPNASIAYSGLPRQSLALLPRNDKLHLVIARAESPWRSTANQKTKRKVDRVTLDTMDRRVVLPSFLQWQNLGSV